MEIPTPKFPNKYLVLGIALVLSGGLLLLWTQGLLPGFKTLWPLPGIIGGLACLYLAFLRKKSEVLIFPGMFLTLGGTLLLLLNTAFSQVSLGKIWPAFMLVSGLSLIPYAYRTKAKSRTAIFIPAFAIIALALVFFPFSLEVAPMNFSDFITHWWPMIPIIVGMFFIIIYSSNKWKKRHRKADQGPRE